ncbi:addiction module antidote protein, HigA family (plasmid) [Candidatus Symbiopectobacterium sp. 'North America']|uniref:HigA family addiction module antitoxin n=1 Tax=Candidatus Symbiopectobacterium sp. 'North America' TaxID=2794574 RepID=UPI0018CABF7B|nr:HigA family addiction module antitoxin [Candidatus Symbiopectobacterium sp. 'North America']MBG6246681.1 addiction module antidote protein, HigA family [Candidatus Symbiopectobacterium sp. 'North America']
MKQAIVSHPGVMVSRMLEDLGVGVRQFAKNIGTTPATVSRFLAGKTALTPVLAIRISAALGSNPAFWMRLQNTYDLRQLENEIDTSGIVLYGEDNETPEKRL